ncbi:luciferase-like monooxygenase [Salmonella enterica]|nr:luciferase-like monooxygenase [Salmonella enterica]
MTDKTIPFSVLDLAPIPEGSSAKEAFTHSLDLARLAEKRGYHRYWLAEHHNMTGIASAATSVLIGYLAANTTTLHLGSGGVMLPNHSPLVIAEQFGTLNTLYPGRIDLGLGRAPGSDQPTMRALRRHMSGDIDNFPRDVAELVDWFDARDPNPHVRPVPGYGEKIPIWLLGSSLYSAQLAAQLGLPFAFASHFTPDMLFQALHLYRTQFKPSARLEKPYAMVCINIIAADSNRDAEFLFTSMQQAFVKLRRGETGQLPPPIENMETFWSPSEQAFVKLRRGETGQLPPPIENMETFWSPSEQYGVQQALSMSLVGDKAKVRHGLVSILRETQADEIMVNGQIFDHQARLHSFDLAMDVKQELLG